MVGGWASRARCEHTGEAALSPPAPEGCDGIKARCVAQRNSGEFHPNKTVNPRSGATDSPRLATPKPVLSWRHSGQPIHDVFAAVFAGIYRPEQRQNLNWSPKQPLPRLLVK